MKKIPISSIPAQPWKNQAGTTRLIATGTGWRVSVAEVSSDAPFSIFPNTRRHSIVIEGDALALRSANNAVELMPNAVSSYAGDTRWDCQLRGRPATVLNVMCENGVAAADILLGRQVELDASSAGAIVVLPIRCSMSYELGSGAVGIALRETVLICDGHEHVDCRSTGDCTNGIGYIIAIRLRPHQDRQC